MMEVHDLFFCLPTRCCYSHENKCRLRDVKKKESSLFSLQITFTYPAPGKNYTHVYVFALGIIPVSSIKQLTLFEVKHVYKLSQDEAISVMFAVFCICYSVFPIMKHKRERQQKNRYRKFVILLEM